MIADLEYERGIAYLELQEIKLQQDHEQSLDYLKQMIQVSKSILFACGSHQLISLVCEFDHLFMRSFKKTNAVRS